CRTGVVRDIHDGGYAAVDARERPEKGRNIYVLRTIVGREGVTRSAVVGDAPAGNNGSVLRLPNVPVIVGEAGDDDHAASVDLFGVRGADVGTHRYDLLAFDQDIGFGEVADRGIHGNDDPILD